MKNRLAEHLGGRVLVLAPTGRDSSAACELLQKASLSCDPCFGIEDLHSKLTAGAGVAILAEEAFVATDTRNPRTRCRKHLVRFVVGGRRPAPRGPGRIGAHLYCELDASAGGGLETDRLGIHVNLRAMRFRER